MLRNKEKEMIKLLDSLNANDCITFRKAKINDYVSLSDGTVLYKSQDMAYLHSKTRYSEEYILTGRKPRNYTNLDYYDKSYNN